MKRTFGLISLLLVLLLALTSCAGGNKFEADGLGFVDKKTDVNYNFAPLCYEPMALEEKIYGTDGDLEFYKIVGQDPLKWLGEADGGVFYAEGITLPTLDKMTVSRVELCTDGNQTFVRDRITDSVDISELIAEYMAGESIYYPNNSPSLSYKLRFADDTIGVYYCVDFVRYAEDYVVTVSGEEINYGTDFLYNRSEKKFIVAPETLSERVDALAGVTEDASE